MDVSTGRRLVLGGADMLLIARPGDGRFLWNPLCFHCKRYLERHGFLFGRRLILGGADMLLIAGGYILHNGMTFAARTHDAAPRW